jgi:hypothetical protein
MLTRLNSPYFVERAANDGCWHVRKIVMDHWVKKVLQGGGA